jgi:N-acetylmuramoyl-L-alanine amidase
MFFMGILPFTVFHITLSGKPPPSPGMNQRNTFFLVFLFSALLLLACGPLQAAEKEKINGLRVWSGPDHTRAVFDLSGAVEYKLFELDNPPRVVLDLHNTALETRLKVSNNADIRGIRHGRKGDKILRLVFDLKKKQRAKSFLLPPNEKYGHRLVVDLSDVKSHKGLTKSVRKSARKERDIIIAVDAGHGGEDPGASGAKGSQEKHITLAIARQLAKRINAEPGMKAILIRDGDYYVGLRKRFEKARKHQADLFVSIHADAFYDPKVHGMSVYVLSQKGATSEAAKWLARSENKADLIGGVKLDDKDSLLARVLLDLSQNAAMEASQKVANEVLQSLSAIEKPHKRHVEKANFAVLKSPDVPSILVETAFISNPQEEKRLKSHAFRDQLAQAILRGIKKYFYQSPPPDTWIASRVKAARNRPQRHIVASGETLSSIAQKYRLNLRTLRKLNNKKTDRIRSGEVLLIPTS